MSNLETLQYLDVLEEIANYAQFSLSKQAILNLRPVTKPLWIQRENARTLVAMELERLHGACPMNGMKDIRAALIGASKDQILSIEDLIAVATFGRSVQSAKTYFKNTKVELGQLEDLVLGLESSTSLSSSIEICFSPSLEVLDNASSDLKHIRSKLRKTLQERQDKAASFILKNSAKLSESISTERQGRIVVLAKNSDKHAFGGFIHGESASGQSAYVEPPILIELNNAVSELMAQEQEEIERICFELSQKIKPHAIPYQSSLETMTLIDSHFARAYFGNKHQGLIATVSDSRELYLKQARHPLIAAKDVVANTYRMDATHRVLLITGPNTGGKTVSLKIIGLFSLLAYSGIPVLADEARLPLFDQVFVDIGDDQSIQQSLSTFSAHLAKLADITTHATSSSLVLLDELGGGTDPVEGESLAMAILNYLREHKVMTVATTHYSKLKQYASTHEDVLIASVQFDMEAMKPTFKYLEGLPGQSYALEIAKRFGLSQSILDQAQSLRQAAKSDLEKLQENLEKSLHEVQKLKEDLIIQERESSLKLEELSLQKQSFEQHKESLYLKAEAEVDAFIEAREEEAEKILETMRQTQGSGKLHEALEGKQALQAQKTQRESLVETLESVKVGQWVRMKRTSQVGQVVDVKKKGAVVQVNQIRMEVALSELLPGEAPVQKKQFSIKAEAAPRVAQELNVIGLRVEEALPLVEQYLDDCLRARLPFCRIIHGHGTGALRSAVHAFLSKQSHIESYRLGAQGEGGVGATVISFKGQAK